MNTQKLQPGTGTIIFIIVSLAIVRIVFPNIEAATSGFTFLGAIALFGAAMFQNRFLSYLFPVAVIFLSDLLINKLAYKSNFFYSDWVYTYIAFILMAVAARLLLKKITVSKILVTAVATTAIHWVFLEVVYWLGGGMDVTTQKPLTKDLAGLVQSHIQALPFEWKTLAGTVVYSFVLFGIYALIRREKPRFAYAKK
jgi:hypothetical protein